MNTHTHTHTRQFQNFRTRLGKKDENNCKKLLSLSSDPIESIPKDQTVIN